MRLQPRSSSAPMASGAECLPALRTLASDCGGLRSGERCLIVTDTGADAEIVSAAETVFTTLGAAVVVVSSPPADLPGDDPPDAVGAAMLEADLIVELTSVFVGSCAARRTACEAGARYLTVPGLTWTTLRPGGPFSADGTVVVDGSLLFVGPDQLATPVTLRFSEGHLVDVSGPEGWRLEDALARSGDERMDVLAEVSIGLNPYSRPGGSALELEGIVGGAHVAVGNNVAYGGSNDARSHIDCVLTEATLALDGQSVDPRT